MSSIETTSDNRLGDPLARQLPSPDRPTDLSTDGLETHSLRLGDTGLGIPVFEPENVRVLPEEESRVHRERLDAELRQKFEDKLKELDEAGAGCQMPAAVRSFFSWTLILIASVLGLFVVGQMTPCSRAI